MAVELASLTSISIPLRPFPWWHCATGGTRDGTVCRVTPDHPAHAIPTGIAITGADKSVYSFLFLVGHGGSPGRCAGKPGLTLAFLVRWREARVCVGASLGIRARYAS